MKIHFIGIGGIGASALARYYLLRSHKVSGSDLIETEIIKDLKKLGAEIFIGQHKKENLSEKIDLIIYSLAVKKDNPELREAKKRKIKCLSYPQALGQLTKEYFTIAISGTHGKSTTCALVGILLKKSGFDPTVIVGTKVREFGNSNCRVGKGCLLVVEADEHMGAFLNYWPKVIVLTSLEKEHLDYYKNLKNILKTYKGYLEHLLPEGILVANKDDKNVKKVIKDIKIKNLVWYSLKDKEAMKIKKVLKIPGEHNILNALAAFKVGRLFRIPETKILKVFSQYQGAWRRFEKRKINLAKKPILLISDYAHHPTEIKATLKSAREKYPKREIWAVFQPHQYQRTYYLFEDFMRVFKDSIEKGWVQRLIITNIYEVAGRENKKIKNKVNSKILVEKIKKRLKEENKERVLWLARFETIKKYLKKNLKGKEILIIMGAGDIDNLFSNKEN